MQDVTTDTYSCSFIVHIKAYLSEMMEIFNPTL